MKGRTIGIALLALLVLTISGLYLALMMGLLKIEVRRWMNPYDFGLAIFSDFLEKSDITIKDASIHSKQGFTGMLYIGNPENMDIEAIKESLGEYRPEQRITLLMFPIMDISEYSKGKRKDADIVITILDSTYTINPDEEGFSFYSINDFIC